MKKNFKLLGIVIIAILFTIAGCKKDEQKPLKDLLIGKWELQNVSYEYYENGVKTGQQVDTFGKNASVYEFLANGNGNLYENGTLKNSLTWTLDVSSLTIINSGLSTTGDISIDNDILTLSVSEFYSSNGVNYDTIKILTFNKTFPIMLYGFEIKYVNTFVIIHYFKIMK